MSILNDILTSTGSTPSTSTNPSSGSGENTLSKFGAFGKLGSIGDLASLNCLVSSGVTRVLNDEERLKEVLVESKGPESSVLNTPVISTAN